MPSKLFLTRNLTLCALLLAVSACAKPVARPTPIFPPSVDLVTDPKPVPPADIVTSAQAAADYDIAVEGWGERGWRAVGRVCRWAVANGMKDPGCAPAPH